MSTMPCTAATTLRQYRGGSWAANHGTSHPATRNAYRMAPIAITQPPRSRDTATLNTKMRNASTSPSKRVPKAVAVPVRRAT